MIAEDEDENSERLFEQIIDRVHHTRSWETTKHTMSWKNTTPLWNPSNINFLLSSSPSWNMLCELRRNSNVRHIVLPKVGALNDSTVRSLDTYIHPSIKRGNETPVTTSRSSWQERLMQLRRWQSSPGLTELWRDWLGRVCAFRTCKPFSGEGASKAMD